MIKTWILFDKIFFKKTTEFETFAFYDLKRLGRCDLKSGVLWHRDTCRVFISHVIKSSPPCRHVLMTSSAWLVFVFISLLTRIFPVFFFLLCFLCVFLLFHVSGGGDAGFRLGAGLDPIHDAVLPLDRMALTQTLCCHEFCPTNHYLFLPKCCL